MSCVSNADRAFPSSHWTQQRHDHPNGFARPKFSGGRNRIISRTNSYFSEIESLCKTRLFLSPFDASTYSISKNKRIKKNRLQPKKHTRKKGCADKGITSLRDSSFYLALHRRSSSTNFFGTRYISLDERYGKPRPTRSYALFGLMLLLRRP